MCSQCLLCDHLVFILLFIICHVSFIHHVYVMCILCVYYVYITCTSHAHHTSHVYHITHHIHITHHMHITCTSHITHHTHTPRKYWTCSRTAAVASSPSPTTKCASATAPTACFSRTYLFSPHSPTAAKHAIQVPLLRQLIRHGQRVWCVPLRWQGELRYHGVCRQEP